MKSIILYCRRHKLPETLLAYLSKLCPDAGTVMCIGECPCAGIRVIGPLT